MSIISALKQSIPKLEPAIHSSFLTVLHESLYNSVDVLTTSIALDFLASPENYKVVFVSTRQNYAHFLSLSKKLGKSFQGHINSGTLDFVEGLATEWTQDVVPICETSPATYISSSKVVNSQSNKSTLNHITKLLAQHEARTNPAQKIVVIIDSADYFVKEESLLLQIFKRLSRAAGKLVIGMAKSVVKSQFIRLAGVLIQQQNDVGGYAKAKIRIGKANQVQIYWKWTGTGFEVRNSILF